MPQVSAKLIVRVDEFGKTCYLINKSNFPNLMDLWQYYINSCGRSLPLQDQEDFPEEWIARVELLEQQYGLLEGDEISCLIEGPNFKSRAYLPSHSALPLYAKVVSKHQVGDLIEFIRYLF